MTCPNCQGPMQRYERRGVLVDRCANCHGVFLDRGELDRLTDVEASWQPVTRSTVASPAAAGHPPRYADPRLANGDKKRKSLFSELFD